MAASGINKTAARKFGIDVHCFIGDEDVKEAAKASGMTRSAVSAEKAARLYPECIYAVGNAPTALMRLYELIEEKRIRPALIIGVPVGFVNVVEAKELILRTDVPAIVARGRKGGSNIAAAICNALLYEAEDDSGSLLYFLHRDSRNCHQRVVGVIDNETWCGSGNFF